MGPLTLLHWILWRLFLYAINKRQVKDEIGVRMLIRMRLENRNLSI